jgi:DNA polymerase III subunit gamma/tau
MAKTKEKKDTPQTEERKNRLRVGGNLATRVRPKTFSGIVGQSSSVSKLRGMIKTKMIPGAILISGGPGLGKTTLARVFARYLNCTTHTACGTCDSCLIPIEEHPDVVEVNMGAERGIDDSRSLSEKARYSPRFSVRVFICDEIHNLTGPAEQALLKIVEEPPANSLFIMCTTNPEKLKPAMLRRCTSLHLKNPTKEELCERLVSIAKDEKVDFDNKRGRKLCNLIADTCNGAIGLAICVLGGVIYEIHGNKNTDLDTVLDGIFLDLELNYDTAAVRCIIGYLKTTIKTVCKQANARGVESCRQLLMKMRWIALSVIEDYAGTLQFQSYAFQEFKKGLESAKIEYDFKDLISNLLHLLTCLNTIEQKMNQTGIDERALFISELCNLIMEQKENK